MGSELRAWRCGHGHVLGQVRRNGGGVQQLLVYRQAVDSENPKAAEVDVMAVVVGKAIDIRCSICGELRTWWEDPQP